MNRPIRKFTPDFTMHVLAGTVSPYVFYVNMRRPKGIFIAADY